MTRSVFKAAIETLLNLDFDDSKDADEYIGCVYRAGELGLSIGKFEEEK